MDFLSRDRTARRSRSWREPSGEAQVRVALRAVESARQARRGRRRRRARRARRATTSSARAGATSRPTWRIAPGLGAAAAPAALRATPRRSTWARSRSAPPGSSRPESRTPRRAAGSTLVALVVARCSCSCRRARSPSRSSSASSPASVPPRRLPRLDLDGRGPRGRAHDGRRPDAAHERRGRRRAARAPRGARARQPRPADPLRDPGRLHRRRRTATCRGRRDPRGGPRGASRR